MTLTSKTCGAVLLAGGQSRRMGSCKALLMVQGETMLSRLCRQLEDFDEKLLSANDPALVQGLPLTLVPDFYRGAGPLGGLHAALAATEKEAVFCVPCDLPNVTKELPRLLLEHFPEEADVMVCRDGNGRIHPLCGIYRKRVLPVIRAQLEADERRMRMLLEKVKCAYLDTAEYLPDDTFYNMNTHEDFLFITEHVCGKDHGPFPTEAEKSDGTARSTVVFK